MLLINDISQLDTLYQRYGYDVKGSLSSKYIRVYTLNKGVYYGADIVDLGTSSNEINSVFTQLSKAGYACRQKKYSTLREAEGSLFSDFFHSDALKERLRIKYKGFTEAQALLLRVDYQYIPVLYFVDDQTRLAKVNIIESLVQRLDTQGPQLIIIEAAAGYGKTCTSYEIINYLSEFRQDKSPIFTELSKDRKASKFKYILQDLILTEFHSLLSEDLVIHEVQSGRIPLVIDGFDELLSKEQDKAGKDDFEQVETMLSTIGVLLKGEAKIILTGRKTAIFSGESFKQWIDESPNEFSVTRFLINPPRIEDWLNQEKIDIISNCNIPIKDISNPVLLAFLRSLSIENFIEVSNNPEQIVEKYFNAILDREQVRQELRLEPKLQLDIFKKLAKRMMEFDVTADTKEWIKILIEEQNKPLLESVRKSYPLAQRPTTEELTNTLSNHALLDRKGSNDKIGFINDFIFGTFIADAIMNLDVEDLEEVSNHMYELAVTAFQFQKFEKKIDLWDKIYSLEKFSEQERFLFEYILTGSVKEGFRESTFDDISLSGLSFAESNQFNKCVFSNCCFKQSVFNVQSFNETSFVNCEFIECKIENFLIGIDITDKILLVGCDDYDGSFIDNYNVLRIATNVNNIEDAIEIRLLSKFFQVGSYRPRMKKMSFLIKEFEPNERARLSLEIDALRRKGYLKTNGDNTFLTEEGIEYAQTLSLL